MRRPTSRGSFVSGLACSVVSISTSINLRPIQCCCGRWRWLCAPLIPPDIEALSGLELGGIPLVTLLAADTGRARSRSERLRRHKQEVYPSSAVAGCGARCRRAACLWCRGTWLARYELSRRRRPPEIRDGHPFRRRAWIDSGMADLQGHGYALAGGGVGNANPRCSWRSADPPGSHYV
jgi:hypothetical protein